MTDSATLPSDTRAFYDQLFGHAERGWLSFFSIDPATGVPDVRWCPVGDLDAATAISTELSARSDVWFGCAIRQHRLPGSQRGGAEHCGWITALWADIDFMDEGHKHNALLPPTEEAASDLVRAFPIRPTAVVHSGGGLQVWHLFDEVVDVEDLGDLLEAYGATWAKVGADAGFHIDNVFDLARIMRPIGTTNHKLAHERPVALLFADWNRRYSVSELRDACIDPPEPSPVLLERRKNAVPYIGPQRPGDEYSIRHDGVEILTGEGFHTPRQDNYGNVHLRAPHRGPHENAGATVYAEDGHTTIWSETYAISRTGIDVRRPYDPFGLYVAIHHAGDFAAATAELRRKGYGEPAAEHDRQLPAHVQIDPTTGEILIEEAVAEVDPGPPLLDVRWVADVLEDMPPEPDVLVGNLLRRGELTAIGAPRAIGKTWASFNLAHLAAAGDGCLFGSKAFRIRRPCTVLYLQGELGRWGSAVRWEMLADGKPARIAEVFDRARIKVVSRRITQTVDGVTVSDEQIDVSVDRRIEPTIEAIGADLVILDPWATFYAGSENDNDETEAAINAITDIARRTDTAWWIVHHISTKASLGNLAEPEDLWRGATRLADAVSTRMTVLPHFTPAKVKELGLDRIEARRFIDIHHLERNGPSLPVQHAERDGWWWKAWEPTSPDGGRPTALSDRDVVNALRSGPVTSKRKLADMLEVGSHATLDRHLGRLIETGIVAVEDGPQRSRIYRLADEEKLP